MAVYTKHFTVAEARHELPELRRIFARIQALLEVVRRGQIEIERVHRLIQSNGHGSEHPEFGAQIGELQELIAQITEKGIEIKDLERGLIDFPHWRDGEEVYLCWLYGEDDIGYWHTLEAGFSGRTPL